MRRRILLAIVGTTTLLAVALTVPLAVSAARREHDLSVRALGLEAQEVEIDITSSGAFDPASISELEQEYNVEIGVYLPDGRLTAGHGPPTADAVTRRAVFLQTNERIDGAVVLVEPVVQAGRTVATIRLAEITPETGRRIRRILVLLAAVDVAAVVFAGLVGWFVSARLARPVRLLRDDAVRLGDGDFSVTERRSGVAEVDETSAALAETARRLDSTLRREREFSVNASHQLRTPVASLRLLLESELEQPRPDTTAVLESALDDVDRLQSTLDTMLAVARDAAPGRETIDLAAWAEDLARRTVLDDPARSVRIDCRCDEPMHTSRAVLDQIVDVLIDNARIHGEGDVTVSVECAGTRLVVTVSDEGRLRRDPAELFVRHDPAARGHGVGLALAQSLAEGEGGRLVLHTSRPTAFRLWLPGNPPARNP